MSTWADLATELAQWSGQGRHAGLWWRDDDAVTSGPKLRQLTILSKSHHVPLAMAVIPGLAEDALGEAVSDLPGVSFLVHGLKHQNHAPEGQKKAEFGDHRPIPEMLEDATRAWEALSSRFPKLAQPVFVPPWNRIDDALARQLHGAGFQGLSRFGAGDVSLDPLAEKNCHLDLINWRGDRGFIGQELALESLISHLQARRAGPVNEDESSGVLSHHDVMGPDSWGFLAELFARTQESDAAHWLTIDEVFRLP